MAKQANSAPTMEGTNSNEIEVTKIINIVPSLNEQIKEYLTNNLKLKLTYGANGNFLNAYIDLEGEIIQAEWIDDNHIN